MSDEKIAKRTLHVHTYNVQVESTACTVEYMYTLQQAIDSNQNNTAAHVHVRYKAQTLNYEQCVNKKGN